MSWNLPPGVTTNDPHINPPAPPSRPVAGYLRLYRQWQAAQARLDRKLDGCAPLRRQVAELRDRLKVREGRLTGGQLAAVRRITHPRTEGEPTP